MKPYGVPRFLDIEFPDVRDIQYFGLNFSKGGKDYFKNKKAKKAIRRFWKKRERMSQKKLLTED